MKFLKILIFGFLLYGLTCGIAQEIKTIKNGESINWVWGDRVFRILVPQDEDYLEIKSKGENYYAIKAQIRTRKDGIVKVARGNPWRSMEQEILVENPHVKGVGVEGSKLTPWYIFLVDARNVSFTVEYYKGVKELEIRGPENILAGETGQFRCYAIYQDGSREEITEKTTWYTPDRSGSFYSIVSGYFVTSNPPMEDEITVTASLEKKGIFKTVEKKVRIFTRKLKSLHIEGPKLLQSRYIPEYRAVATFTDGSSQDVTGDVSWEVKTTTWRYRSDDLKFDPEKKGKLVVRNLSEIIPAVIEASYRFMGDVKMADLKIDIHPDASQD